MTDNMSRFTQRSRHVFRLAQDEAERGKASEIDTAHLLIALIRESDGIGAGALRNLKLTEQQVIDYSHDLKPASSEQSKTPIELSPDTKRALRQAAAAAHEMGHLFIDTGHLLIAATHFDDSVAAQVLKKAGISPEDVLNEVRRLYAAPPPDPPKDS